MPLSEVPVLVVGAGPSGVMMALLLERQGISTIVVERRPGTQRAPAAHVVNARSLEICRAAGVDMDALAAAAKHPADAGYVYWVPKLGGRPLGRLAFERQGDDQLALTPTPLRNLSQNRFEPILLDALQQAGGHPPRFHQQWESSEQTADGIRSRIRDRGTGQESLVSSRYLIAADGAGSRVRTSLCIEVAGPERIQSFVMVHFRATLRGIPDVPPGVLFFTTDPPGVFVIHDLDGEAVYMHAFDPETDPVEDFSPSRCEDIVRSALEDPGLDLSVETVSTWAMTAQVAEHYRDGRIFLVGDAAHRFPPTGGLGLNSGVQDAHNLAWKLAAVLRGDAPESLLDSFEKERRPVAQANADQSLKNALRLMEVPQALAAGGEGLADAIAAQAEHFDMPGLQLGFWYPEGAVLRDPGEQPSGAGQVRSFTPSGCPGARLPHAWLRDGASLLDCVSGRFLLVTGPEGGAWIDGLAGIPGPEIRGLRLSHDLVPDLERWLEQAGIEPTGALLVRPDQHVAWRARRGSADPAGELSAALSVVLRG